MNIFEWYVYARDSCVNSSRNIVKDYMSFHFYSKAKFGLEEKKK